MERSYTNERVDLGSRGKSEVITIRLTPKMKFGLELMARLHKRSVAQTADIAIQRLLWDPFDGQEAVSGTPRDPGLLDALWSPHRGERLRRMVFTSPELVAPEEEVLWNQLVRSGRLEPYLMCSQLKSVCLKPGASIHELEDEIARFWDQIDEEARIKAELEKSAKKTKAATSKAE